MAEIEREEARRQKVVEAVVAPPSRRVNFTITAHPFKDELIILGGEFYDGQKVIKLLAWTLKSVSSPIY